MEHQLPLLFYALNFVPTSPNLRSQVDSQLLGLYQKHESIPDNVGSACLAIRSQISSVPFMFVVKKTLGRVGDQAADVK